MKKNDTLRKFYLTLALLTGTVSSAALAHPEDKDPLSRIGVGASIVALTDINVKPGEQFVVFLKGAIAEVANTNMEPSICQLQLANVSDRDRRIPKDTTFTIKNVNKSGTLRAPIAVKDSLVRYTYLELASRNVNWLVCRQYSESEAVRKLKSPDFFELTIGEMKAHLSGLFDVKFAKPEDISGDENVELITE